MTEFKTHEAPKEKRYCLQFETDNRSYFLRVQTAAAECMDHKPLTNYERIKAMTVEEMAEFLNTITTLCYDKLGSYGTSCFHCPLRQTYEKNGCGVNTIKKYLESEVQADDR